LHAEKQFSGLLFMKPSDRIKNQPFVAGKPSEGLPSVDFSSPLPPSPPNNHQHVTCLAVFFVQRLCAKHARIAGIVASSERASQNRFIRANRSLAPFYPACSGQRVCSDHSTRNDPRKGFAPTSLPGMIRAKGLLRPFYLEWSEQTLCRNPKNAFLTEICFFPSRIIFFLTN
jgi:hypothetical protein